MFKCRYFLTNLFQSPFHIFKCQKRCFHHCGSPLKLMQTCLSAKKDLESSFHHYWDSVKLVQASLSTRKNLESRFNHCLRPVKPSCNHNPVDLDHALNVKHLKCSSITVFLQLPQKSHNIWNADVPLSTTVHLEQSGDSLTIKIFTGLWLNVLSLNTVEVHI